MRTYVHKQTKQRFPEHGCAHWFYTKPNGRFEIFERGIGWRKGKLSEWDLEIIEDLPERFTIARFRAYAEKYGVVCAREFLPCCDSAKPAWGAMRVDPSYPNEEVQAWFAKVFGRSPLDFQMYLLSSFVGRFVFDIVSFEDYLAKRFGYPKDQEGLSMREFMQRYFGIEACDRFETHFLKQGADRAQEAKSGTPAPETAPTSLKPTEIRVHKDWRKTPGKPARPATAQCDFDEQLVAATS